MTDAPVHAGTPPCQGLDATEDAPTRTLLPLHPGGAHGRPSRSYLTCRFRCGNQCAHPAPNPSDNGHIQDEIARAIARRTVLRGAAALGAGAALAGGTTVLSGPAAARRTVPGAAAEEAGPVVVRDLGRAAFDPVAPNVRDAVTVAKTFRADVLISWGDPLLPGAPAFDVHRLTPDGARKQFGYNNDYLGLVKKPGDNDIWLLCVNHEYTSDDLMLPADAYDSATFKRLTMVNHGLSVVEIRPGAAPGSWLRVPARQATHNRRLVHDSLYRITGPAAGDVRLRTRAHPAGLRARGTFGNCSGGMTPWGTILSGEENFQFYFDKSGDLDPAYSESYERYGVTGDDGKGWMEVDRRFDLTKEPREPYHFGWIVEYDPTEPESMPLKHTMLGRIKHEGANIAFADDGRVVAYTGDDERGEYLYRFVSRDRFDDSGTPAARRHNKRLLTRGTLSVARFRGDGTDDGVYDGTGTWLPLASDTESFVAGMSVAEVLLDTRIAADRAGATRMDRPEDVEPNPVNGKVYAALTNNSDRGVDYPTDEANPLRRSMVRDKIGAPLTSARGNRNGYVLEITPIGGDHARPRFTWDLMLVCGDPEAPETYFAGFDKAKVSPISCPDNVAFDAVGNLWVSTDGNALGSNDGLFRVPTAGASRGRVQQFLTVPRGAETCGPLITDDQRTLFFAVQHPGEIDGATFDNPGSTWPHTHDFPRPSVCVAYKAL